MNGWNKRKTKLNNLHLRCLILEKLGKNMNIYGTKMLSGFLKYTIFISRTQPLRTHVFLDLVDINSQGVLNFHFGIGVRSEGPQIGV